MKRILQVALGVLAMLPIIGVTFGVVLGKVRKLFKKVQEATDWLNKVINESILGSTLIRLLNSQQYEYQKFLAANTEAKAISMSILRLFAALIPVIVFSSPAAHATAAIKNRLTTASVATVLFVFIVVPPILTRPRSSATLKQRFVLGPASNCKGIQNRSARDGRYFVCAARPGRSGALGLGTEGTT